MFRFRNNFIINFFNFLLFAIMTCSLTVCSLIACNLTACSLIDLRPIGYSVEPDKSGLILPESHSPIIVKFDTEMIKHEAEVMIQVNSNYEAIRGDFFWIENNLHFIPVSGWTAGIRYTLNIRGSIRSVDGRELLLEHFASFYAMNKNDPPLLESVFPADEESVGISDFILELGFSCSMDRFSVESALTVEGFGNKIFEWSEDDKILKVAAEKELSPWMEYRWNLKDSAKNIDGVPLPKQYSGAFIANLDLILPQVTKVYPAAFYNGFWSSTGADIKTGLSLGQAVVVEFNKPMGENAVRSLRFEPSLTGRAEMLAENSVIFIFTRDLEPETQYTLIVSADTRDSEGLKIGEESRFSFLPDIPYLSVIAFNDGEYITDDLISGIALPIRIEAGTGLADFSIRFSFPFKSENSDERINTVQKISLTPFFPRTLAPIALEYVKWLSDDRLQMRWENLNAGDEETKHYYKLTIPGGRGGISSSGMYMKEDIDIYLEAVYEN